MWPDRASVLPPPFEEHRWPQAACQTLAAVAADVVRHIASGLFGILSPRRVERIWCEEGLKVPKKQPKRKRLWLNNGSGVWLRSNRRNHVWSYRLAADRTSDGRPTRMMTLRRRVQSGVPGDRCRQEVHQRRYARAARATCSSAMMRRITSAVTLARAHGLERP